MMTHSLLSLNMVLMVVMVMNSPIDTFEEQNYRRFDPFFYGEGTPDFGPNGNDAFAYLDDKYDQSVIPMQTEEDALPMIAEINLRNILEVDEATMTIIVETTLRFIWTDDRIMTNPNRLNKAGYVVLNPEEAKRLWIPDIIIDSPFYIFCPHGVHQALRQGEDQVRCQEELRPCLWNGLPQLSS